jgi:hypothetical protein
VRNYWALLPAVAVCVVLALLYVVPTLVNPQFTANALALFRREDGDQIPPLTPKERRLRRLAAVAVLVAALGLVGFNVSLNREANGCYLAAQAWGADDSERIPDPCIDKIFGASFSNPGGDVLKDNPQPVKAYQVVRDKRPRYIRWVNNRPSYDKADLIVGAPFLCNETKFKETEDKVVLIDDIAEPCPSQPQVNLVTIDLDKPLGDRKVVTIGDKPVKRIDPDMPSWGTVLKKLATGG